jgi:hypothetical protein
MKGDDLMRAQTQRAIGLIQINFKQPATRETLPHSSRFSEIGRRGNGEDTSKEDTRKKENCE